MAIQSYKDLDVWQKSVELVVAIYSVTKSYPREEIYTLVSQMRRASISIPANIAEGHAKSSTKDFMRFISIAYGSAAELETHLIISEKLNYLVLQQMQLLLDNIGTIKRMLNGLRSKLEKRI